jgi:hypothetical protein
MSGVTIAASGQRTIVVSPTQVGQTFTLSGCGYTTSEITFYVYREVNGVIVEEVIGGATSVGSDGCFTLATGTTFTQAGAYEAETFQLKRSSHGSAGPGSYNENHPAAYLDFTVTP